jgi:hypothetical protein
MNGLITRLTTNATGLRAASCTALHARAIRATPVLNPPTTLSRMNPMNASNNGLIFVL